MFPRPIEQTSALSQTLYKIALPVALILWLLPLIGVAVTSLRPASDLAQGNYFGMPSYIAFENYWQLVFDSAIPQYMVNSLWVTIPTVIGAVASVMGTSIQAGKGFALCH
mgnify:CR=1 FL=1